MSSVTVDFVANPRSFTGTTRIRFFDRSVPSGSTITFWGWTFYDAYGNWTTNYPTTNNRLYFTNASTYWTVGDQVYIQSSGSLPTGLTQTRYYIVAVTTTYLQISLTKGGTAASWTSAGSGTHSIYHISWNQNPVITVRSGGTASFDVKLVCVMADSATQYTTTKAGFINRIASAPSKPTETSRYGEISIFIYDSSNAVVLNRDKTTNNPLLFGNLEITNQMNLGSIAVFDVYNVGSPLASTTDKGLLVSNKNVVIVIGTSIVYSGIIWRSTQTYGSLFDDATQYQIWRVECESDISKMKTQEIKTANKISYTKPVGYIVSKLVENNTSSDINWNGVYERSLISFEGPNISYTIGESDMYQQFLSLANMCGYDWRTRNCYSKYYYSSYSSSVLTVASTEPYFFNGHRYKWVLFLPTSGGIVSYGLCTSNTPTNITLGSIKNPTLPPSTGYVIVLGDPVLDFTNDLRQNTPVATFTSNQTPSAFLQNCYGTNDKSDFKDIATKVIAKGKSATDFVPGTTTPKSISVPLSAKNKYNEEDIEFENTSYIQYKTEGRIIYHYSGSSLIALEGLNYALKAGDFVHTVTYGYAGGVKYTAVWSRTINFVLECPDGVPNGYGALAPAEGTVCTLVNLNPPTYNAPVVTEAGDHYLISSKMYCKDTSRLIRAGTYTNVYVGAETQPRITTNSLAGTDTVYGKYLYVNAVIPPGTPAADTSWDFNEATTYPHLAGTPITNDLYSETSPQTGSPINLFGLITKTITPDQNITKAAFEIYLINALLTHSFYYRKGGTSVVIYDWYKPDARISTQYSGDAGWIMEGDMIGILQATGDSVDDMQYGQYKNRWQVISWKINSNEMTLSVELGNYERNMFVLMNDKTVSLTDVLT